MPGTVVLVAPGRVPTQLAGAPFQGGTTLFNNSREWDVWVSDNQSAGINLGFRIGPLGSITWRGGIPWAAVGTNLQGQSTDDFFPNQLSPVYLTISSDVVDPVNPVDVAIATGNAVNRTDPGQAAGIGAGATLLPLGVDGNYSNSALVTVYSMSAVSRQLVQINHYRYADYTSLMAVQKFGSSAGLNFSVNIPLLGSSAAIRVLEGGTVWVDTAQGTRTVPDTRFMRPPTNGSNPNPDWSGPIINRVQSVTGSGNQAFGSPFVSNGGPVSIRYSAVSAVIQDLYLSIEEVTEVGVSRFTAPWGSFPTTAAYQSRTIESSPFPPGIYRMAIYTTTPSTVDMEVYLLFNTWNN